jgi:hypothetical protein
MGSDPLMLGHYAWALVPRGSSDRARRQGIQAPFICLLSTSIDYTKCFIKLVYTMRPAHVVKLDVYKSYVFFNNTIDKHT